MAARGIIRQYYLLLTKLQQGHFPTKAELMDELKKNGFATAARTVERYMEQLRDEFKIDIDYNKQRKGYAIRSSDEQQAHTVRAFLERLLIGELLTSEVAERSDALNYVVFDTDASYKGLTQLEQLLLALRHHRMVAFDHASYQSTELKRYPAFRPYFLKEYQNRWYLVGQSLHEGFARILGTDRMTQVTTLADTFDRPADAPTAETFAHLIGVAEFYKAPERVRLAVATAQLPYFNSLP